MTNHTPLPWRLHINHPTAVCARSIGPDGLDVAECGHGLRRRPSEDARQANAALIVKAVNHHQNMADLLREGVSDMGNRERVEWKERVEAMLKEMEN